MSHLVLDVFWVKSHLESHTVDRRQKQGVKNIRYVWRTLIEDENSGPRWNIHRI